ncbi:MAG: xanthine dehydrogenase family protein molybdopterin-binding subunit [Rhodospirillales bacterium]|jgi:CO/xanthine dehydrogenase Mo-binding subunit|nr:oxidoreductase [Rhodospirillaceae bacterium]MDP6430309.1 xanthine dehydrogenase family protein molybdopterin-binding subunit [Rhodospirillales bacterium]MDP6646389.1 xanthine dehydrogenase family protein molybdopterin-binding subunit [Rhodospirillales bacterium]
MPDDVKPDGTDFKWVGKRNPRPDGVDKVTGRAKFGADLYLPGMLTGKMLRSPHAHARIKSIDTSKAEALAGVKAVVTSADFPDLPKTPGPHGPIISDFRDISWNMMARGKVLYDGHPVAAVAATSESIARKALKLIEVEYEVLPHVIDPVEAMQPGAPILHDDQITEGEDEKTAKPSNVYRIPRGEKGDVEKGFAGADVVIEREYTTKAVHQGYIEPHACVAHATDDGVELFCSTQGHFVARSACAKLLGMDISRIRVTASEIGGGFGGKNNTYGEPVAIRLSQLTQRPVKIVMSRNEVFRASGPTSGTHVRIKIGAKKDGTITAAEGELTYQAGAFKGASIGAAINCMFSPYDLENVKVWGYDVCVNRPKVAAYRAPGVPMAAFGVESTINELADELGLDRVDLRLKNAAKEGTRNLMGLKYGPIGFIQLLEQMKAHDHYNAPLGENQGRGMAAGFWLHAGGVSCASVNVSDDGTVTLIEGNPDIGGSRASMAAMVAEELGIDYGKVRPIVGDTSSIGFTFLTAGSRTTFATGMACVEAARGAIRVACDRAAQIWGVSADEVVWEDGHARPAGANVGDHQPMSLAEIAAKAPMTGGPIAGHAEINATGQGPATGAHLVDVEVDKKTGQVKVLRYTVFQDVGRAISPGYVEGQLHGGAVQGIGWALNEEYVYDENGVLENPGFLDYRVPVASDVPMIDVCTVEVPNPNHPYGVRGVGETPIVPPQAAVANAVGNALGMRFRDLPLSPPKILKAIKGGGAGA